MSNKILNIEGLVHIKGVLREIEEYLKLEPNDAQILTLKTVLKNRLKYIENYFIPYREMVCDPLLDLIPTDDTIIYSTNMHLNFNIAPDTTQNFDNLRGSPSGKRVLRETSLYFLTNRRPLKGGKLRLKDHWDTYALFTQNGLVLHLPIFFIENIIPYYAPSYVPWNHFSISRKDEIVINSFINGELSRLIEFEPEEVFTRRKSIFNDFINNSRIAYTIECKEKAELFNNLNDHETALRWIENGIKSNVLQGDCDWSEDLIQIKASILHKQTQEQMKKIEETDKLIINFLRSNTGLAFTFDSMMKRLEKLVENFEILDYLQSNLKGTLNKLLFDGKIQSNQHEGKIFYFV